MADAIALKSVTKTFGETRAVDSLDLAIPRSGLYGFIGPNGAGKTTSIRMIMSILFPDAGELSVLGHASALDAKDRIGYLPEERGVYRKMKVGAYLRYIARLKGLRDRDLEGRVRRLLERIELPHVVGKRCAELSKGMLQKIQFLAAIIHEPELLILDEPFSGLDPVSMRLLRDQIVAEHTRGATILFSTHIMPQAEEICDHVVMVHRGRKVLDDPIEAIHRRYDPRSVVLETIDPQADVAAAVAGLPMVEHCGRDERVWEIVLREGSDAGQAMRALAGAVPIARIELKRPRLEDVFVQLVTDGDAASEAAHELRAGLVAAPAGAV